ncbi:MAG: cytochrome c oxidase subunit II [Candidatus Binataceae bacterium]
MSGILTLDPFSPFTLAITHLTLAIFALLGAIFVLVLCMVTYAIVRYRDRPGGAPAQQIFGWRRLELLWTATPICLLIVVFIFTAKVMRASDPPVPAGDPPELHVVAHQWWWQVDYLKSGIVTANEIHIPVGQPWLIRLTSADVIHDFWVAQLARKIDVVPGHPNHVWIEADQPGVYQGECAEFCGNEHAWMRFQVIAQPPAQFEAWVKAQRAVPPRPVSGEAAAGFKIFEDNTCANCHTVSGTSANQSIGPDLTHLASRKMLAGGAAENTPENLYRWIKNPASIKPGSHMPNFQFTNAQAKALVSYLETLK